ncbi:Asp23/Gls24 family envelope stress response protein [Williamsia sp.]|uniref:Asp23/Gls24 family envelope stress response protein n=1 Tax=Williamsia sp. TaxID=1872085 RepID=UPI0025DE5014|nr:Asp23/Gls24 family envelope stress response protein [Williamsia sp.]
MQMTSASTTKATTTPSATAGASTEIAADHRELVGAHGRTTIADQVVSKIAGIAAREIDGVFALGGQTARIVGRVREAIPGGGPSITQGVTVEVGEKQAAVDLGLVANYGVAIHELAAAVRSNVINAIQDMTSLEVTEVNIAIHDIHFEDDETTAEPAEPRVQ